ncbi:uncharacterized protein LOC135149522 [Daucus carota subsp. sativus]|uniref:uncharacterized protein LOC135149522 n=1 Tax=Daucus carota subsp. sativus TaxID=79200 RepID=UPI0030829AFA
MDKSWIAKDRDSLEYEMGVEQFLIFAEENSCDPKKIPCPCSRCVNFKKYPVKIIRGHLYEYGFSLGYVDWIWHKKESRTRSVVDSNCRGPTPVPAAPVASASETVNVCDAAYNSGDYDNESYEFRRFLADAEQPLFDGSECTKLESMLKLHNWKARFGISDSAFTDLLSSVGSLLPKDNVLPQNAYAAKKTLSDLGLEWKVGKHGKERVNVPAKVMWYFPIIPRFRRMFKSPTTSEQMTWHAKHRIQDGKMRHPADSPSWRNIDYRWPEFGSEAKNIRLALSADGINPHNNGLTNRYTCWQVVLVIYNLPPWLAMKRKFMMLTILVSGPHEPGNNIDVYLQSLIDDLKKLWEEGEPNVYDAHSKSYFNLRAVLLWTINDFPAYGNLSGCVNKGYMCCPVCGDDTVAKYLSHSRKMCYLGHRRYLPRNHPYRRQRAAFNGEQELGHARQPLSGEEVLAQQERIKFEFGREGRKSKKVDCPWKKKSIFFELEYWKFHHVRHCLDVMHVEKNVCDSVIGTLLNMKFKSKDTAASRLDMIDMGVRADLAPEVGVRKTYLPPSVFNLSKAEKKVVLSSLMHMKLPYGHASNIKNCVSMDELKMFGMKSHDCHILLQQLLPVAIRSVLPKHVRVTIIRLCFFFNALCCKIVDVSKLDKLQTDVIVTLCDLEKIFPASFFDVMIHLVVHLVRELRLCGPVFYRWMYASERFNKVLKSYVRNRYYPEGCIAESYLGEESVEFCQEFVNQSCTTAGIRKDAGKLSGPLSVVIMKSIEEKERDEAHLHVLLNNPEVHPYIVMHKEHLEEIYRGKKKSVHWLLREHNRLFADWFEQKVSSEMMKNPQDISDTIRWLAGKPSFSVFTYEAYLVDGVRYFTKDRDHVRVVQNSGVSLVAKTVQVSSAKDKNPVESDMTFYGVILEIWELDYHAFKAPLLILCNWADNDKGIKVDDLGFTLVDLSRQGHKKDKYVSTDQVKKVFYVEDPVDAKWSVVLTSTTRDYQEVYNDDDLGDTIMENPPFCSDNSIHNSCFSNRSNLI